MFTSISTVAKYIYIPPLSQKKSLGIMAILEFARRPGKAKWTCWQIKDLKDSAISFLINKMVYSSNTMINSLYMHMGHYVLLVRAQ